MSKEKLLNKIKKLKINKYKALFMAGAIGLLPSLFKDNKPLSYKLPKEVTAEIIIFGQDTIASADFYKNVTYSPKTQSWDYHHKDGKTYNTFYLYDYKRINDTNLKKLKNKKLQIFYENSFITYKEKIVDLHTNPMSKSFSFEPFESLLDKNIETREFPNFSPFLTIEENQIEENQIEEKVEYSPQIKKKIEVLYNFIKKSEGLGSKALYLQHNKSITMLEMKADTALPKERREALQKHLDLKYNREDLMYNYDHEFQHHENAEKGINKLGMSLEQIYLRRCHDELSANIRQFWKQRDSYLKNGNDVSKLPTRSKFYDKLVKENKIQPVYGEEISEKEQKYITEEIQKIWDKTLKHIYSENTLRHIKNLTKK